MRVLWVSHFVPYPPRGGNLQRSYHLLRHLASRHEVRLLAFSRRSPRVQLPADREAARAALGAFCADVTLFPLDAEKNPFRLAVVATRNLTKTSPVTTDVLESRQMAAAVSEAVERGVDLVHLDTIDLAPYADGITGVPVVLHHHNVESLLLARRVSLERNPVAKAYLALQTMRIARMEAAECGKHALNVVVSRLDGENLRRLSRDARVAVVPNGVDLEYFEPKPNQGTDDSLVWAGSMRWHPNRDAIKSFLHDIWPKVRTLRPQATFELMGHTPPPDAARDGVRVHGFVSDIRPIVGRAGVYVVPIRIGGGTRLKILDAMAMGKAIVSTSVGCEGLEVTPGSDILVADSPDEFARQVARVLEDRDLRERLGAEARRTVERLYGWERVWRLLDAAYEEVAGSNGKHGPQPRS